jgi:hypothetical protein
MALVFDDATALDTPVAMRKAQTAIVPGWVGPLLRQGECPAAGLLGRHEDRHLRARARQEPRSCHNRFPVGKRDGGAAAMGCA